MENFKFILSTDSTADLPKQFLEENNIPIVFLNYSIEGKNYNASNIDTITEKEFYDKVRSGSMPTTSQINPDTARNHFEKYLKQGYDVLHIAFSSKLSGSCNSAKIAAEELSEEYKENKVIVFDSKAASLGEGLLVYYVMKIRNEGKPIEDAHNWLIQNRDRLCHFFTVDDLYHLYRGGRISKTSAFIGTMLGVKPVLHVDEDGKLVPLTKVRGRKNSLDKLVDYMKIKASGIDNSIVFISHGDCLEDAEYLRDKIKEELGVKEFIINYVGPVIGSHSGPGTIALFFVGENKKP